LRKITNDLSVYKDVGLTADSKTLITVRFELPSSVWVAPANDPSGAKQIASSSSGWDGWAGLEPGARDAPVVDIPARRLHLLTGPITAVHRSLVTPPGWQSPILWWPDDRAWCVETEVDFMSTYFGGMRACIAELTGHPDLEVAEVRPADGVNWPSDEVNPRSGP